MIDCPALVQERLNQTTAPATIPLCVPEIRGNEWRYLKECLDTGWVSSVGSFVSRFEEMLAGYVGARYAVATVNGTAALHVALLAAGIEPEDEVLVSTLTFIAPANAVRYAGAHPVFVDADPQTWQMDVSRITDFVERECRYQNGRLINSRTGRRVRAIVPVHILGHPVDMEPLNALAETYDLEIIEDATESLGAAYNSTRVGHLGHIACFSFNGNKIITTGGGGMVVTDDEIVANRIRYLTTQAKKDPVEYIHEEIGFNYRLTNIQAAVGCAQMELLDEYVAAKRRIAVAYNRNLEGVPGISALHEQPYAFSTFWMYTVLVEPARDGRDSRELMRTLAASGIQSRPLWQPLHRSKAHSGSQVLGGEVAEALNAKALSLPSSVGLSLDSVDSVSELVRNFQCDLNSSL
ncbi:MAG: LegC family aminotransferase [Acidobacteriaceae bacterium]|nr:LegC family aminotransferase [Acidobacteriaceae bacterium]